MQLPSAAARTGHAASIIYRHTQWPRGRSRTSTRHQPDCPEGTCTPPRELLQASGHARIALFLPRDARYGCLNSRGEPLGAFADFISSKTPLLKLLCSNNVAVTAASCWDCPSRAVHGSSETAGTITKKAVSRQAKPQRNPSTKCPSTYNTSTACGVQCDAPPR